MRLLATALFAATIMVLAGCATTAKQAGPDLDRLPDRAEGEVAVFGGIRLMEFIGRSPMPAPDQDGSVYLTRLNATGNTYRLKCAGTGEFGAFLPAGDYRVTKVSVYGYTFEPEELGLSVPAGHDAAYAGTVVLDGTPTGAMPGGATRFVFTVKDEYGDFAAGLRRAGFSKARLVKSLFRPGSAFANGDYPTKVFRAKDVENDLAARTGAVEEAVRGGLIAIPYVLNPIWIFTLP